MATDNTSTDSFKISGGQVLGPDGKPFIARGIDVMEGNMGTATASALQAAFPGVNFVRLAVYDYANPQALMSYVNQLTSQGIVVELEDHATSNGSNAGGSSGQIFSGQQLRTELNWYSSIANAFKSNPYVWFGTNNEPSEIDSSGAWDPAALSTWQQETYQAIRGTGNTSPILVEMNGWADPSSFGQGYTASAYASMTNIVWDEHYYGWLSNYSTDPKVISANLAANVAQGQTITSADGKVPVIIGEYGNSTTGMSLDSNGTQVVNAVIGSGLGSVAWAWGAGNPGDGLLNADGSLSDFGKQVAAGIAAKAKAAQATPTPTSTPTPTATPSPNDTAVNVGSAAKIIDGHGNAWTITTGGQVAVNGTIDTTTANVTELAYVNGKIWQENTSNLWWSKTSPSDAWGPSAGTSTSPLPPTAATIALRISEDVYQGDAQFTVSVDGKQVGGTMTASALHASGDSNVFLLTGTWATGSHQVAISFLNDLYAGTATTDRNLYVNSAAYNGATEAGSNVVLMGNGTATFTVGSAVAAANGPADTVTVHLSEDAWNGDARFILTMDGKAITTAQDVAGSHAAGAWQDLTFTGNFGTGSHTLGVQFTNDAYGGTTSTDRNLYVNGIDVNGVHYGSGVTAMMSSGNTNFAFSTAH